jgi:hypothetical protein
MVEKRFRTLRFISTLYKIIGMLLLIAGTVGGLLGTVLAVAFNNHFMELVCYYPSCTALGEPNGSLLLMGIVFALGLVLFLCLFGLGEAIALGVSIEENTRRTAFILRMWVNPQPGGSGAGTGPGSPG